MFYAETPFEAEDLVEVISILVIPITIMCHLGPRHYSDWLVSPKHFSEWNWRLMIEDPKHFTEFSFLFDIRSRYFDGKFGNIFFLSLGWADGRVCILCIFPDGCLPLQADDSCGGKSGVLPLKCHLFTMIIRKKQSCLNERYVSYQFTDIALITCVNNNQLFVCRTLSTCWFARWIMTSTSFQPLLPTWQNYSAGKTSRHSWRNTGLVRQCFIKNFTEITHLSNEKFSLLKHYCNDY